MNRIGRIALASLSVIAFTLSGCATKRRPAPRPAPFELPSEREAMSAARYVELAASSAQFLIRSSELAQSRASDARLRGVALAVAGDHQGISAQLSFSGRRLNLLPRAVMTPVHQSMLAELGASADFDAIYRRQLRTVLNQSYAVHRGYLRNGTSPTLRQVAAMAEPILRRDIERLRDL